MSDLDNVDNNFSQPCNNKGEDACDDNRENHGEDNQLEGNVNGCNSGPRTEDNEVICLAGNGGESGRDSGSCNREPNVDHASGSEGNGGSSEGPKTQEVTPERRTGYKFSLPRNFDRATVKEFLTEVPALIKKVNIFEMRCLHKYLMHAYKIFLDEETSKSKNGEQSSAEDIASMIYLTNLNAGGDIPEGGLQNNVSDICLDFTTAEVPRVKPVFHQPVLSISEILDREEAEENHLNFSSSESSSANTVLEIVREKRARGSTKLPNAEAQLQRRNKKYDYSERFLALRLPIKSRKFAALVSKPPRAHNMKTTDYTYFPMDLTMIRRTEEILSEARAAAFTIASNVARQNLTGSQQSSTVPSLRTIIIPGAKSTTLPKIQQMGSNVTTLPSTFLHIPDFSDLSLPNDDDDITVIDRNEGHEIPSQPPPPSSNSENVSSNVADSLVTPLATDSTAAALTASTSQEKNFRRTILRSTMRDINMTSTPLAANNEQLQQPSNVGDDVTPQKPASIADVTGIRKRPFEEQRPNPLEPICEQRESEQIYLPSPSDSNSEDAALIADIPGYKDWNELLRAREGFSNYKETGRPVQKKRKKVKRRRVSPPKVPPAEEAPFLPLTVLTPQLAALLPLPEDFAPQVPPPVSSENNDETVSTSLSESHIQEQIQRQQQKQYETFVFNNAETIATIAKNHRYILRMRIEYERSRLGSPSAIFLPATIAYEPAVILGIDHMHLQLKLSVIQAIIQNVRFDVAKLPLVKSRMTAAIVFAFLLDLKAANLITLSSNGRIAALK